MTGVRMHELIVDTILDHDASMEDVDVLAGTLTQALLEAGLVLAEVDTTPEHRHAWYLAEERELSHGKVERIYRCNVAGCNDRTRMVGPLGPTPFDPI